MRSRQLPMTDSCTSSDRRRLTFLPPFPLPFRFFWPISELLIILPRHARTYSDKITSPRYCILNHGEHCDRYPSPPVDPALNGCTEPNSVNRSAAECINACVSVSFSNNVAVLRCHHSCDRSSLFQTWPKKTTRRSDNLIQNQDFGRRKI